MLGAMLGTHPDCLTTPEASFFFTPIRRLWATGERQPLEPSLDQILAHWSFKVWDVSIDRERLLSTCTTYPELLLGIVAAYGRKVERIRPAVWVDHAPGNVKNTSLLFELFPGARLIHIVRDGRAAAASVMKLDWGPNTAASAAKWWVTFVTRGLSAESIYGPDRVIRVLYEDLVSDPESSLKRICSFVGLDYRSEMISGTGFTVPGFTAGQHSLVGQKPLRDRVQAWREMLTSREIEIFESIAVDLLTGLGYETIHGWQARRMTSSEKIKLAFRELYQRHVVNRKRLRRRIDRSVSAVESRPESRAAEETARR